MGSRHYQPDSPLILSPRAVICGPGSTLQSPGRFVKPTEVWALLQTIKIELLVGGRGETQACMYFKSSLSDSNMQPRLKTTVIKVLAATVDHCLVLLFHCQRVMF